jgi:tRNA nucleotidyltransferase/poly(A) polymerase
MFEEDQSGVPQDVAINQELTEEERIKKEIEIHFENARKNARIAYAGLSGNKDMMEKILKESENHGVDFSAAKRGIIWLSYWNHDAKKMLNKPIDYVYAVVDFLKEYGQRWESAKEESKNDQSVPEIEYVSAVDKKHHKTNKENWKYHILTQHADSVELLLEEALEALKTFGEIAKSVGDKETEDLVKKVVNPESN